MKNNKKKDKNSPKQNKSLTILYFVLRGIIVTIFVLDILNANYESAMTCVLTFILLLVPSFMEKKLLIQLPTVFEGIVICFVFAANILGEIGSFYEKFQFWDTMLHTLNGFVCAGVGFGLTDILNRSEKIKFNLSPIFVCLFSFCFSMTVGMMWEFFEFAMDNLFSVDMQKDTIVNNINSTLLAGGTTNEVKHINGISNTIVDGNNLNIGGYLDIGIIDTMKDLFVNFIGAIVFNVSGYFYLKYTGKKAGFVTNFIPELK